MWNDFQRHCVEEHIAFIPIATSINFKNFPGLPKYYKIKQNYDNNCMKTCVRKQVVLNLYTQKAKTDYDSIPLVIC